jgi:hypothetical protein
MSLLMSLRCFFRHFQETKGWKWFFWVLEVRR